MRSLLRRVQSTPVPSRDCKFLNDLAESDRPAVPLTRTAVLGGDQLPRARASQHRPQAGRHRFQRSTRSACGPPRARPARPARASWRRPGTAAPRATARRPAGRSAADGAAAAAAATVRRDQRAAGELGRRAQRRGSSATPRFISTARLMPSRLGSAIVMFSFSCRCSNRRSTLLAGRRRLVVRDDVLLAELAHRHLLARRPAGAPAPSASPARPSPA